MRVAEGRHRFVPPMARVLTLSKKAPCESGVASACCVPPSGSCVPKEGKAHLDLFCAELAPDAEAIRRLQHQMERKLRANNLDNYDERDRVKKHRKQCLAWKHSQRYERTWRRKGLHGRLAHEIVALGKAVITELRLRTRSPQDQAASHMPGTPEE